MNIGDKFGKLTISSERYKKEGQGYAYFVKCVCECGSGEKEYRSVSLTKSKRPTLSCGCIQKEKASELKTEVIGKVFNKLTITTDLGMFSGRRIVLANCECGTEYFKCRYDLVKNLTTKSCGCVYKETRGLQNISHGMSGTLTYSSWQAMKERCRNPNSTGYENYGGRGITYDPSWESFENFFADMGERPLDTELDRKDVEGNYSKDNCVWSDATIQTFNKRKREGVSSKYFGVSLRTDGKGWDCRLHKYGEVVFRKTFYSEEEAARAYDEACFEHYGVRKNFPDEN